MKKKDAADASTGPLAASDVNGASLAPPVGSKLHHDRFLPEALALADSEVRGLRLDPSLAIVNARTGVEAVWPHRVKLERELPCLHVPKIGSLLDVGAALMFAAGHVERWSERPNQTRAQLARAVQLRSLMLAAAEGLVIAGVFEAPAVEKIRRGRGAIDTAGDCVELGELFRSNLERVAGKIPFGEAEIAEAAELGTELLLVLRPRTAPRRSLPTSLAEATNARNRLWTLFETTWELQVWRAGAWLFGRAVDEHVPPLGSRVRRAEPKQEEAPAAPAPEVASVAK